MGERGLGGRKRMWGGLWVVLALCGVWGGCSFLENVMVGDEI